MKTMNHCVALFFCVALLAPPVNAQLQITELRSKAQFDPEDYFELTNLGAMSVSVAGWQFDDESADINEAAPIEGVTDIAPGESVVIFQLDEGDPNDPNYDPTGELAFFRTQWGGLAGVQVGYHGGAGLGKGDAINLFDSSDNLVLTQEYGMTMPNQTHAGDWAAGNTDGSDTFENQAAVWIPGTDPAQFALAQAGVFGSFADSMGDYGSPGVVPEPCSNLLLLVGLTAAAIRRRR